jgi:spore germination cell wall hydrolase CwlJ-like protein
MTLDRRRWALACLAMTVSPCIVHAQETPDAQADQTGMASAVVPLFSGVSHDEAPGVLPVIDDHDRALDCMSMAIAYEAAGQPIAGQQAVGQVILNRMRAARFPKTVCGVVFQGSSRPTGCQFTFACDGSFRRHLSGTTLTLARTIAQTVLQGTAPDRVGGATHYHADYVLPYWASSGQQVAKIGAHIFYRMPNDHLPTVMQVALVQVEPDEVAIPALQHFTEMRHTTTHRTHRPGPGAGMVQGAPAASHAFFAPWGLAVAPDNSSQN